MLSVSASVQKDTSEWEMTKHTNEISGNMNLPKISGHKKPGLGGTGRAYAVGFSIGNRGYIGTGRNSDGLLKDFWEYTPDAFSGLTVNRDSYEDANTSITKLNESVINNTEHSANFKFNFEDQPNAVSDLSDQIFFDIAHLQLAAEKEKQTVQVYPNPLSSSATITFFLKEDNHTTIQLNDLTGRKLHKLFLYLLNLVSVPRY